MADKHGQEQDDRKSRCPPRPAGGARRLPFSNNNHYPPHQPERYLERFIVSGKRRTLYLFVLTQFRTENRYALFLEFAQEFLDGCQKPQKHPSRQSVGKR
ncbi:hypothetical protein [Mesorhizobium sp. M4A.F.Ca.ET.090.04.2.1]|uniref:hypothetical protein n=1 Tax=Mesorhizobium sp. M4A.F.Ca.ET.090.04.2.1 TaxID=2496663 RepID=UPI001AEC804E|nr:hypothetical protein [Mesorhizobium sp. M4A.F.Ca.ET.090.04.2.1]